MLLRVAEHVPRCVPDFVTEVSIPLHATDIKLNVSASGSEGVEGITQGVSAITGNAVGKLFSRRFLNLSRKLRLHEIGSALCNERLKIDTVD